MPRRSVDLKIDAKCKVSTAAYQTWEELNSVMKVADEKDCWMALKTELKGPRRQEFVYRIHSRLNRVRAHRERDDLQAVLDGVRMQGPLSWLK